MNKIIVFNILELVGLYKQGFSLRAISGIFGVSRKFIRSALLGSGSEIRSKNDQCFADSKNRNLYKYFDVIDSRSKAYWLGFILADGSVFSTKGTMEIGLALKDVDHLQSFASIFGEDVSRNRNRCRYSIYSSYFCKRLIGLGIVPRKTYIDDTTIFDNIPNEFMNSFILGFMDGDGSVYMDKRRNNYIVVNFSGRKSILGRIKDILVNSLGVNANKIGRQKSIYKLEWSGNQADMVLDWLYRDSLVKLERKHIIYKNYVSKIKQGKIGNG